MADTHGYQTINDRSSGFGPGVDAEAQPDADAAKESTSTRLGRTRIARKTFKEDVNPAIADRTIGFGGTFDPTDGADGGYGRVVLGDETPAALANLDDFDNGVFRDEANDPESGTGSNTALGTSHSEANVANRTADSRNTVQLNDANATKRAEAARTSIVDRTSGWGHTAGSLSYRND